MSAITRHLYRCFLAGLVALLPVGGVVLTVVYLESTIAGSWLADEAFYFPGLGIVTAVIIIYAIGLIVSTFVGRWLWSRVDSLLDNLPALGQLYQTLKQILGYGQGEEAIFQQVVLIRSRETDGEEIGLVTNRCADADGGEKLSVFVPGAPNPTAGRLVLVDSRLVRPVDVEVNEALKSLLSVGKTAIPSVPS